MKTMKTIFVLLTSGFSSRNIIETDIFKTIKENNNIRAIFIIPKNTKNDFLGLEVDGRVIFEEYEKVSQFNSKFSHLRTLNSFSQGTTFQLNTKTIQTRRSQLKERRLPYFIVYRFLSFLTNIKFIYRFLTWIDWFFIPKRNIKDLFNKYNPDLLFSTDPMFFEELYFLEYAKRNKIKIISLILSWDNFTGRGGLPILPDKIIVWNEIMQNEAMIIYGYDPKDIFISGAPQFDIYFKESLIEKKEEFFKKLKLDPNKKLLVYATGSPTSFPTEERNIDTMCKLVEENKFIYPVQLLIRLNPRDNINRYTHLLNKKDIIFDSPGRSNMLFRDMWNPTISDMSHLAATLKYSDIVFSVCSTISIEAVIFDTPIINLDINDKFSYYYGFTHFSRILATKGTKVAKNINEIIEFSNQYLANKDIDKEGRNKILNEHIYYLDGGSGRRIGAYLISNL